MAMKITTIIDHEQDEYVRVYKKHSIHIPFTMWGCKEGPMNIIKVTLNMTKPEHRLFDELVDHLNEFTHISTLNPLPPNQSNKRSATMKLLVDKGLVKKVGPRSWMINPELLVPEKSVREAVVLEWLKL